MASDQSPNPWAPFDTYNRDCSQGICSFSCPQWCYMILRPPPPYNDTSTTDFSPLIIAVVSIIASAFLLVSYYTVISKYCKRNNNSDLNVEFDENQNQLNSDVWRRSSEGLDESVIKSIAICKYKKRDGFVEGTDCSVCLSEFVEDETLRLLPKCNHAFHLPCIDTWLKSHSSCPLCRYDIRSTNPAADPVELADEHLHEGEIVTAVIRDLETGSRIHESAIDLARDGSSQIRRSVSLDDLRCGGEHDDGGGSSSMRNDEDNKLSYRIGVLNLVCNHPILKRSISTERFVFSRYGKGRNSVILPN